MLPNPDMILCGQKKWLLGGGGAIRYVTKQIVSQKVEIFDITVDCSFSLITQRQHTAGSFRIPYSSGELDIGEKPPFVE